MDIGETTTLYTVRYADGAERDEYTTDWHFANDIANAADEDELPSPAEVVTRRFRLIEEGERVALPGLYHCTPCDALRTLVRLNATVTCAACGTVNRMAD